MTRLKPSPAMVVAFIALVVSLTGGAYAAVRINTRNIANRAVTHQKLATNSVRRRNIGRGGVAHDQLAPSAVGHRNIRNGAVMENNIQHGAVTEAQLAGGAVHQQDLSSQVVSEIQGAKGEQGPAGAKGEQGPAGPRGPEGSPGGDPNRVTTVTSLSSNPNVAAPAWGISASNDCGPGPNGTAGTVALNSEGAHVTIPGVASGLRGFAGIDYNPAPGIKLTDVTGMQVTWKFSGGGTVGQDSPFAEIILADPSGTATNSNDVITFGPNQQAGGSGALTPGRFQTWNLFAPGTTWNVQRVGTPGTSTITVPENIGTLPFANEDVAKIQIQAGCSASASDSTATISSAQLELGSQVQNFRFSG